MRDCWLINCQSGKQKTSNPVGRTLILSFGHWAHEALLEDQARCVGSMDPEEFGNNTLRRVWRSTFYRYQSRHGNDSGGDRVLEYMDTIAFVDQH